VLYRVVHETTYAYSEPASISHNLGHLLPRRTARQALHHLELRIDPSPADVEAYQDYFGNDVVTFSVIEPHDRLCVRTESRVEITPPPPVDADASPPWEEVTRSLRGQGDPQGLPAREMIWESPFVPTGPAFAAYARESFSPDRRIYEALIDFNHRIHEDFRYDPEATTLATPIEEVLEERHGVCQDFAHLMIGCLRSLGLSARYVSGYIRSADPAKKSRPAPDGLVGSEASHAWVSAWCPPYGWLELDPTNDLVPSDQHVLLAYGRDYDDVSPLKGVTLGGGEHSVQVRVEVRPTVDAAPAPADETPASG